MSKPETFSTMQGSQLERMMRTLLIAEAVPLKEKKMESVVLSEFVRLFMPDFKDDYFFESKSSFLDFIDRYIDNPKRNRRYGKFKFVHLSGHARYYKRKGAVFSFPKGDLNLDEFPKNCFTGISVTFSACDLGKKRLWNILSRGRRRRLS